MSEMLMEDYIREQINRGQYGVIVIPISTAEDIAYYIETSRDKTEPVRHGKWIEINTESGIFLDYDEVKCSECGFVEYFNKGWARFKYCPTCGARMDVED